MFWIHQSDITMSHLQNMDFGIGKTYLPQPWMGAWVFEVKSLIMLGLAHWLLSHKCAHPVGTIVDGAI